MNDNSLASAPAKEARKSKSLGRRERSKIEKKARITAAARALFATQGFENTTTLQIAEAADIGNGTLFLYAKSKEDLLVMVFKEEMQSTALESFRKLPEGARPVDQVMTVFERMVKYHEKDFAITRILIKEVAIPPTPERADDLSDLMDTIFGGLENIIRAGQEAQTIPKKLNPALAAQSIFAIYFFGLLGWLGGNVSREAFLSQLRTQLNMLLDAAP